MSAKVERENVEGASGVIEVRAEGSAIRSTESGLVVAAPEVAPDAYTLPPSELADPTGAPRHPLASASGVVPTRLDAVTRFGKYDILGRVAVGGMAEIFLVHETLPGGTVRKGALKVIKRSSVSEPESDYFEELFLREGRTIVQLAHPHICHVYDIGKQGDHLFIAMEWIDGRSLRDVLARLATRDELVPPALAIGIAMQVASALEHAHNARDARGKRLHVVHRDVNPQNIMLRYDGSVKLVDFGVARVSAEVDTRENTVKGKPTYMAPEQLLNKEVDARADVFALGVCLYEMLSGLRLHKRATMRETLAAVLQEPAPSLLTVMPDLPPALDAIVQRALAKRPEQRFASAGELEVALERFLADSGEIGSARRVGELMSRLYPQAGGGNALDTSAEATHHLSSYAAPAAYPWWRGRTGSRPRLWLGVTVAIAALAVAVALAWPRAVRPPVRAAPARAGAPLQAVPPPAPAAAPSPPDPPATGEAASDALSPPTLPAKVSEPALANPRPKRRQKSPGFVADPGF